MQVEMEKKDGKVYVESPYLPELPTEAKKLGGKWSGKRWVFDVRDIQRVKSLYLRLYGEDGETPVQLVSVQITCKEDWHSEYHTGLFLFGKMIARAFGRDSGAKLGENVLLLKGDVTSGGSRNYWRTIAEEGSVIVIRDVPITMIENEDVPEELELKIIEETKVSTREELLQEQQKLMDRINEIDKILKEGRWKT